MNCMENSHYKMQQYSYYMLIQTHTKRIFDLEPINNESAVKLKQITYSLNAHIQALKAVNHDPYNWGALLYMSYTRNSIQIKYVNGKCRETTYWVYDNDGVSK